MNGQSSIQVLAQGHAAPRQRSAPKRLLDLQHPLIELHGVVAIHHALVLEGEDPIQVPPTRRHKRCPALHGPHRKAPVEFRHVVLAQENGWPPPESASPPDATPAVALARSRSCARCAPAPAASRPGSSESPAPSSPVPPA